MDLLLESVVRINRLFPKPRVGGRESDDAYSEWEYRVGREIFQRHFAGASLADRRILDVGCGLGGKTVWYAESGASHVVGLDLDAQHAAQSRKFAAARGQSARIDVLRADAMRLPFAAGRFDVVTANDSLEHFADPAAALRELGRVLRPGGRLYLYFTPFKSPLGSHLYDHVKIPWSQLLLSRRLLYGTLARAVHDEERSAGGDDVDARAAARTREVIHYFEHCVNGITVRKFHDILNAERAFRARDVRYTVPKFGFLQPLLRVPALREYWAGLVFADLERVES
ncbi:MAG TPA: class I SAM-dependent methyltransferase [Candidatus Krumholzibacteria bacterium]|nr:class I SAM-dependent methyltransferase [Candidatus Krumholzibacteria bacterium]